MFSRPSPRGAAFEVSQDSVNAAALPPPPPRNPSLGPDSRRHVRRPPTLNTTVSYLPGNHLTTPTPSSLSSPFVLSAVSHATTPGPAPGSASRGVSPDNHRLSGNFSNMTYNPQEWASGRQSAEPRQRRDVYGEPIGTPPPPYADQRSGNAPATVFWSPSASVNTSPVTQHAPVTNNPHSYPPPPRSNTTTPNAHVMYDARRPPRLATYSGPDYVPAQPYQQYQPHQSNQAQSNSLSYQVNNGGTADLTHLPPPPRRTTPNVVAQPESDPYARMNTRRSTSAGPASAAGPSMTRGARTYSNGAYPVQSDPNAGVSLPGPPPMPPPPSSRSRSVGGEPEPGMPPTRQRPPRLSIKNSNLETIPATPIDPQPRSRLSMFPLRIDTGNNTAHGKAPAAAPVEVQDEGQQSRSGTGPLARRSAVRGPAARAANQARSRSRGTGPSEVLEQPMSAVQSANPWASALEQTRSPMNISDQPSISGAGLLTQNSGADLAQSQTPPITPNISSQQAQSESSQLPQQAKVLPTPPLSQKPLLSANSLNVDAQPQSARDRTEDPFVTEATQRHAEFVRKEQEANTDLERLELFMHFVQQESLIRKDRYIQAFRSDDFDLDSSKNMLFNGSKVRRASGRESNGVASVEQSPVATNNRPVSRNDTNWWKDYRPALSPIASMDYDEQSSRGRAPSRWWESAGSQSDGNGQGIFRTKRESKYMSLSKNLLQSMENGMEPLQEDSQWPPQYPDEKANPDTFGYYDEEIVSPPLPTPRQRDHLRPSTLDISRFITLPPPYPRHFPAVNNNHPDLTEYRTTVRMLSDLTDVKNRQARHKTSVDAMRTERQNKISESRKNFRATVQKQIADGSISYAEAAEAENFVKAEEHEIEKQGLQAEFDTLQDVVINPLHEQLNEKVAKLGNSLQSLQRDLFASAANQNPDQPVQEGDDVPELLEQLTQLKWLFEARETLHQELFNLLSQRNDSYKAIVALPYKQANNMDKVRDTEAFFDKDAAMRYATFCAEALKRHESFLAFVEENALRGIEMQSSAFWDITPGLGDLLQKIPTDLNKLDIHVPEEELRENPSYQEHPQQYLYLLIRHAERSSYQFIEGQINLYCLLHEVKTGSLTAHYRETKAQQQMAGDSSNDMTSTRQEDEGELTQELKNRAAMIEEQWRDALGKQLEAVKERVKKQLQKRGAWDEIAAETEG